MPQATQESELVRFAQTDCLKCHAREWNISQPWAYPGGDVYCALTEYVCKSCGYQFGDFVDCTLELWLRLREKRNE